jgi:hypothetical protein
MTQMPTDTYNQNPALRPTVLVHEVMKTVFSDPARAAAGPDPSERDRDDRARDASRGVTLR